MNAYLLIHTEAGTAPIAETLRAIPGVVSADDLSGAYDAIALVRSGSTRALMDGILAEVRSLPGVTRALPAPVARSLGEDPSTRHQRHGSGARVEAA